MRDLRSATRLLCKLYLALNDRDLQTANATLTEQVTWTHALTGEKISGLWLFRQYWEVLWSNANVETEPLMFEREKDGRFCVEVHQKIIDHGHQLISDEIVHHIFTLAEVGVTDMEIRPI